MDMQIIVPMSGFGERFRRAGYAVPKPLIEVDGKPIIAHVVDMFPGASRFVFVCNNDHLNEPSYHMKSVLKECCPTAQIVGIEPHKLGPVHAVLQAEHVLDPSLPCVVNYCDFTCYWDWHHFCSYVSKSGCDGAIPAYRGFHPHSLGSTQYAYMREKDGWVEDIQEKQPYTNDRMNEYASSGTYFYARTDTMLEAFRKTVDQHLQVNGEYYVSLTYKPLLQARKRIAVYDLQHFMQWGTPEDLQEYQRWSDVFRRLAEPVEQVDAKPQGAVVVPMAGLGERFSREGYTTPKPLIPVSGKPMVLQALHALPLASEYTFVVRSDMEGVDTVSRALLSECPGSIVERIPHVTEGQACTALIGLDALDRSEDKNSAGPVTCGACDSGSLYSLNAFLSMLNHPSTDVMVWAVRGHPHAIRHPNMYGWLDVQGDRICGVSVKKPLNNPHTDPIVLGIFTFKRKNDLRSCVQRMFSRNARVNNEFYLDTCIEDAIALGLTCKMFEVDSFISWGTPNDLRTFEYWQSCFHKWSSHPYRLEKDVRVPKEQKDFLDTKYRATVPVQLF